MFHQSCDLTWMKIKQIEKNKIIKLANLKDVSKLLMLTTIDFIEDTQLTAANTS